MPGASKCYRKHKALDPTEDLHPAVAIRIASLGGRATRLPLTKEEATNLELNLEKEGRCEGMFTLTENEEEAAVWKIKPYQMSSREACNICNWNHRTFEHYTHGYLNAVRRL
jgi:hypothetical protein